MGCVFVAFIASVILLIGLGPGANTSIAKKICFIVSLLVAVGCIVVFSIDAFTVRAW